MAYVPSCPQEEQFLRDFDPSKYQNPAVAADIALFALDGDDIKILLIRRGNYPFKDCWALPGGFVNIDEDILACAHRELFEETGISGIYLEQVFTFGRPDRDPRQRVISVSRVGIADISALYAKAGDDAAETGWFSFLDYTAQECNGNVLVKYVLNGCKKFCPKVSYPKGYMQQITAVDSAGLAADHAESIAYAFAYLLRRVQSGFLDLAFSDKDIKTRAQHVLLSSGISHGSL